MLSLITVEVDYSYEGEKRFYAVSLSADVGVGAWLASIHIAPEDIGRLREVTTRSWEDDALRIGDSAGASVFWSMNDGDDKSLVIIAIGPDDESSDITFAVPAATISEILDAIAVLDAP
jgi:hypothetical protein